MDQERRRKRRWVPWLVLAAVVVAVPVVGSVLHRVGSRGCCGPSIPYGELWYCREPDPAHPVGDVYLLRTQQVDKKVGQTTSWPDRLETGHVGTPLRWPQPAGAVTFELNLDPAGPGDTTVDERQSATVREGEVTAVLVPGGGDAAPVCPVAPTAMATPRP